MNYFNKKTANSLIDKMKIQVKNVNGQVFAGFGKASLFGNFEYPLKVEKVNHSKIKILKWTFNETPVVYFFYRNNKLESTTHTTISQLFDSIEPYIHMIDMKKVEKIIANNKKFTFIDDILNCHIEIKG